MKLAQENEKLKAELKALTDRLEAAEGNLRLKEHPSDTTDTHPWLFTTWTMYTHYPVNPVTPVLPAISRWLGYIC